MKYRNRERLFPVLPIVKKKKKIMPTDPGFFWNVTINIGKTGNSRSRFRYFIFEISRKPSFVEAVFYDELRSFSTFFALNFDKKLAVE
jgi:hypothetical protein